VVTLLSPPNDTTLTPHPIYLGFNATDDGGWSRCTLYTDMSGSWAAHPNFTNVYVPSGSAEMAEVSPQYGLWHWNVSCTDGSLTSGADGAWQFTVSDDVTCYCSSCGDCSAKLRSPDCTIVKQSQDIEMWANSSYQVCVEKVGEGCLDPGRKVFDGNGYKILGNGTGIGISIGDSSGSLSDPAVDYTFFVLDSSGSMSELVGPAGGLKISYLKNDTKDFVDLINVANPGLAMGLVKFSATASELQDPTTNPTVLKNQIDTLLPMTTTSIGAGLQIAVQNLSAISTPEHPGIITLVTDGNENKEPWAMPWAIEAANHSIILNVVTVGDDAKVAAMTALAKVTGGTRVQIDNMTQLYNTYVTLGGTSGMYCGPVQNYTVQNVNVTGWNFGIAMRSGNATRIVNSVVTNVSRGIIVGDYQAGPSTTNFNNVIANNTIVTRVLSGYTYGVDITNDYWHLGSAYDNAIDVSCLGGPFCGGIITSMMSGDIYNNDIRIYGVASSVDGVDAYAWMPEADAHVYNNSISIESWGTVNHYGIRGDPYSYSFGGKGVVFEDNIIELFGGGVNYGIRSASDYFSGAYANRKIIRNNSITIWGDDYIDYGVELPSERTDCTTPRVVVEDNRIDVEGTYEAGGVDVWRSCLVNVSRNTIRVNGSLSANYQSYPVSGVYFTGSTGEQTVDALVEGNSITMRGADYTDGVTVDASATGVVIRNNSIDIDSFDQYNDGIGVWTTKSYSKPANVTIANNTIRSSGWYRNTGVHLGESNNVAVVNNSVITNGTNGDNYGIWLEQGAVNATIAGNRVRTNGTSFDQGIRILANNATIANNSIITGGTGASNHGILLENVSIAAVRGNTISTYGTDFNHGVFLTTGVTYALLANNTVTATGSGTESVGVFVFNASHNIVANNTITANATDYNFGVAVYEHATNVTVSGNVIRTDGTAGYNYGIDLWQNATGNRLLGNDILTHGGDAWNVGIGLEDNTSNTVVDNNRIMTSGTGTDSHALMFWNAQFNNASNNTLITGVPASHGIYAASGSNHNLITNSNITTTQLASYGIFTDDVQHNRFVNSWLYQPTQWIWTSDNTVNATFLNTSFFRQQTTVQMFPLTNLTYHKNLSTETLIPSYNGAYLNGTDVPEWNMSARITFRGLTLSNPYIVRDTDDDHVWESCPAGICFEESYAVGTLIFNVTHFTNYSAQGNITGPTVPIPVSPINNSNNNYSRFVTFVWGNSTSPAGIKLNYTLEVSTDKTFASNIVMNVTVPTSAVNETTFTNSSYVFEVDTQYFWRVRAYDGDLWSDFSNVSNFTIPSVLAISLVVNVVNFGNFSTEGTVVTNQSGTPPFTVRNDGNIDANITILGTAIFSSSVYPADNYRFLVEDNESSSLVRVNSTVIWTNMTNVSTRIDIASLDWNDTKDTANIHVKLTPPTAEPPGQKYSDITVSAG
jgi:hypothetical protein